jgi:NitT/TauT family transport system substrate-binding protein
MFGFRLPQMALVLGLCAAAAPIAHGEEVVRIACSDYSSWPNVMPDLGNRTGIFKKYGLRAEPLYTNGGGETLQTVLSGSVDFGLGIGTYAAFAMGMKGAPLKIVGNAMSGVNELTWYVRSDSAIKSLAEAAGMTVSYSTAGSSTQMVVKAFEKEHNIKFKEVATGSFAATMTQVLSGQVAVGWGSAPPILGPLDKGQIRIVAHGNDIAKYRGRTVRMLGVNKSYYEKHRDTVTRFVKAFDEVVRWAYTDPAATKMYAEAVHISEAQAVATRAFYPPESMRPGNLSGLDVLMQDAVDLKFIPAPLSAAQMHDLIVPVLH